LSWLSRAKSYQQRDIQREQRRSHGGADHDSADSVSRSAA
jgi:hypothetical protein